MNRTLIRYWLPVVIWAAIISFASTDEFSAQNTGTVIERVIAFVVGHPLPAEQFDPIHFAIRKLGHLTEYAILGLLAFRAVRGDERGWNMRWALMAIGIAAAVAIGDELHQRFVPSRTSSPVDVVIDTVGATISQIVWRITSRRTEAGILETS